MQTHTQPSTRSQSVLYGYLSQLCLTQPCLPFTFKFVSALAEIQRKTMEFFFSGESQRKGE